MDAQVVVALILMVATVGVFAIVVLTAIALDVAADKDYTREIRDLLLRLLDGRAAGEPVPAVPRYHKPIDTAAVIASAQRAAAVEVDPAWGKLRPVDVTPSSEDTPVSPVDPATLAAMRAEHASLWLPRVDADGRPVVVPMQPREYRGEMPALGEDEERPGWEPKSGTFTREGR